MKTTIRKKFPRYPSKKVRKGDRVLVISGAHKGEIGVVKVCDIDRVTIDGVNLVKKCVKKTNDRPGSIVDIEKSIHISNVVVCDEDGKALKLKVQRDEEGNRHFVYKKKDQVVVYRSVKTPKE